MCQLAFRRSAFFIVTGPREQILAKTPPPSENRLRDKPFICTHLQNIKVFPLCVLRAKIIDS